MEQSAFDTIFQIRLSPSPSTAPASTTPPFLHRKHPLSKLQLYFFKFSHSHPETHFFSTFNCAWERDKRNKGRPQLRIFFGELKLLSFWSKKIFVDENCQKKWGDWWGRAEGVGAV